MATAADIRKVILQDAQAATNSYPTNVEARLHSFIARLSGSMEGLGERDLDTALWKLFETPNAPAAAGQAGG